MKNKILIIFILSILLISSIGGALAQNYYPLRESDKLLEMSIWDRILYNLDNLGAFTVIHDATCYVFPYDVDFNVDQNTYLYCPTIVPPEGGGAEVTNKGCAFVIWEGPSYQNYDGEYHLNPGQELYVDWLDDFTYELYPCPEQEVSCLCGGEYDAGCGYENCPSDLMGRAWTCEPAQCDTAFYHVSGTDISYTCVSRDECITPTCIPNWQCNSWSSCISNQQTRTCSDLNNCGTTDGKPSTLQSCTSPDPTCQAENLQLTTKDDDFKVNIKTSPTSVVKDSTINIVATVTNRGGDGKMLIECGVYPESYVKGTAGWLFSLIGTPQVKTNCVTTEDFVQTKEIALCSGQSIDIPFTFKARKQADTSYIFCQPYERCGVR